MIYLGLGIAGGFLVLVFLGCCAGAAWADRQMERNQREVGR